MPSASRDRIAETDDDGVVLDRHEDVDDTTIQFPTIREDVDAAPLLAEQHGGDAGWIALSHPPR